MFYEEQVVNGQFCFRTEPKGEWHIFSYQQLLEKYLLAQTQLNLIREQIEGKQQ